jgi:hypothetical protein
MGRSFLLLIGLLLLLVGERKRAQHRCRVRDLLICGDKRFAQLVATRAARVQFALNPFSDAAHGYLNVM